MSRLIIVSNRVADVEKASQSGGLAVALGSALEHENGIWFGWDGTIVEDGAESDVRIVEHNGMQTATVPLTESEYESYYLGFSNRILWPAFHYRLDLAVFEPAFIEGYRRVNARLAKLLAPMIEPGDLIWIHDYHLIPMAAQLRELGVTERIGFFLHIPFPAAEIYAAVPEHAWLADCLLAYDVVGVQTAADAANFTRYCADRGGVRLLSDDAVVVDGRKIVVKPFPIGIDAAEIQAMAHTACADERIGRLQRRSMASSFVIGVDRLDYTKGLPERLRAFRRLLEVHPELTKAVTLMQVSPPTREGVEAYVDIRQQLETLSGSINGDFGDFDWTPVRYIHRSVPRSTLAALYRGSRVGLVTPLRDGMNLVAKEYVAAQDAADPGVLVLSKFAGAAEALREALIVNPYEVEEVAAALHQGLTMPLDERRHRHRLLSETVMTNDVTKWRDDYLAALASVPAHDGKVPLLCAS